MIIYLIISNEQYWWHSYGDDTKNCHQNYKHENTFLVTIKVFMLLYMVICIIIIYMELMIYSDNIVTKNFIYAGTGMLFGTRQQYGMLRLTSKYVASQLNKHVRFNIFFFPTIDYLVDGVSLKFKVINQSVNEVVKLIILSIIGLISMMKNISCVCSLEGTSYKVIVENENQTEISFTRTWTDGSTNAPLNVDKRQTSQLDVVIISRFYLIIQIS